jgi:hypothetical protein
MRKVSVELPWHWTSTPVGSN